MENNETDSSAHDFIEGQAFSMPVSDRFEVALDNYEGPLDVLLSLARAQKVDLKHISVLRLAEQYIDFIRNAEDLKIELAADYLVMASWLAYLKSRLLLPVEDEDEEMSAEELSARLLHRLQKLEAIRHCMAQLMARNILGRDIFARGMPDGLRIKRHSQYQATLYDLLTSYSIQKLRYHYAEWKPPKLDVLSVERARTRLETMLGKLNKWDHLDALLFTGTRKTQRRTALASGFAAALEFAREGRIELQQEGNFGKIMLRRARPKIIDTYD